MKIITVFFSPTQSTQKYIQNVTLHMDGEIQSVDITSPEHRDHQITLKNEMIILGFPVYGMRIPKPALDYFSKLKGNGNLLAGVVVYGNVDTGIVFKQLQKIARAQNFRLIGVGCFVAQHAYSTKSFPVAPGRPTNDDLLIAQNFGEALCKKVEDGDFSMPILEKTLIPTAIVNAPYNGTRRLLIQPQVNLSLCNHCNRCKKHCPVGAITDDLTIVEKKCLRCLSCVKNCPVGARKSQFTAGWMGRGLAWMGRKNHPSQFFI